MKNNKIKIKILILILSSIIASTNLSSTTIKRKNNKKEIYNILNDNEYLDQSNINYLYLKIINDYNIDKNKEIKSKMNYLYYLLNKKNINNNYKEYLKTLTGKYLSITNLDNLVPQGITYYKDYIIFSAYNENRFYNSYLYIIDKHNNLINTVELDNNSHVGGIAFDEEYNLLWVTVKDKLYGYKIEDIISKKKIEKSYETFGLENIGNFSFLTYKNKKIYIGNYNYNHESIIKEYKLSKRKNSNEIIFKPIKTLKIPEKIQGADFITIDNQEYLLLSSSYYIFEGSKIFIYKYDKKNTNYTSNYISELTCPPMLEEIKVTNNNELITLYESCSQKYSDCPININHIYYSDIKKKIKK